MTEPCGWRLGFDLPPKMTVSEWADQHRHIAKGTGPEEGRWRTERAPFQREPMDAFNDLANDVIVLKMSSQVGKTEILINASCYFIDHEPAPQMLVMPDLGNAEDFSRVRFQRTIEVSPRLLDLIGEQRTRAGDNTLLAKTYPGGDIVFAGANSPASLASKPRRIVICDEINKYKRNIGQDGNPIFQAFQRTENFWNARKAVASTPTVKGLSEIDIWFDKSDKRHFEVPCPHCGQHQVLLWDSERDDDHGGKIKERRVVWPKGEPRKAEYSCAHCGQVWTEQERHLAVKRGRWRAHAPFKGIAGFYLNALYSPWVTLAKLAKQWEDAEGDPTEEQAFVNLKLGLAYDPSKGAESTVEELLNRREKYGPDPASGLYAGTFTVPEPVVLVTVFVDVQGDRFEVQYLGWGPNEEKWVLDYRVLYGDPTDPMAWQKLDMELLRLSFAHPLGGELEIAAVGVDAGNWQQVVMNFVTEQSNAFRPFYAIKGVPGMARPLFVVSSDKFKMGAKLYLSGVDDGKAMVHQELARRPDPKTGEGGYRVHFPHHLEQSYFEMLLSERVKIEYKAGRAVPRWIKVKPRNEAFDTFVGCVAVRHSPHCKGLDLAFLREQMRGGKRDMSGGELAALFKR